MGFKAQSIAASGKAWTTTGFYKASFELITRELDQMKDYYSFKLKNMLATTFLTVVDNKFTFNEDDRPVGEFVLSVANKSTGDI